MSTLIQNTSAWHSWYFVLVRTAIIITLLRKNILLYKTANLSAGIQTASLVDASASILELHLHLLCNI